LERSADLQINDGIVQNDSRFLIGMPHASLLGIVSKA